MTPGVLLSLFRNEMQDTAAPYLWSDADVYLYIDDAHKMFCRLTDGISDASTTAVVDIAITAGSDWVNLHPRIKKIRGVTRTSDGAPLEVLNYEDMPGLGLKFTTARGLINRLIVGMEDDKARVHPVSIGTDALKLLVFRLPIVNVAAANDVLEIDSRHHMHLLPWVKRCALLKQDVETFDRSKAAEMEGIFRNYCAAAMAEQGNKRHKVRTVRYGGC